MRSAGPDDRGDSYGRSYSVGAGGLFGLNENTADVVLKWALGVLTALRPADLKRRGRNLH